MTMTDVSANCHLTQSNHRYYSLNLLFGIRLPSGRPLHLTVRNYSRGGQNSLECVPGPNPWSLVEAINKFNAPNWLKIIRRNTISDQTPGKKSSDENRRWTFPWTKSLEFGLQDSSDLPIISLMLTELRLRHTGRPTQK